jgi:uncharacterized SAM-binding protein YcdF (DUF218 family)
MITTALLVLLLIAAGLLLCGRHHRGFGVLFGALALFWMAGNGMLAAMLLDPLQAPFAPLAAPRWGARNAIVLLGAGVVRPPGAAQAQPSLLAYSRILEAVRLYRDCQVQGKPCTLVISGGDPARLGVPEAAIYRRTVLGLGVQDADLALEDRSLNTFQNAEYTSGLIGARGFDQVVLVTSGLHMRRALLFFAHFHLPCAAAVADRAQPVQTWIPLGANLALADLAAHEHVGMLRYRIYTLLGLNARVAGAGRA